MAGIQIFYLDRNWFKDFNVPMGLDAFDERTLHAVASIWRMNRILLGVRRGTDTATFIFAPSFDVKPGDA